MTWIAIAALCALIAVAALDAVRSSGKSREAVRQEPPPAPERSRTRAKESFFRISDAKPPRKLSERSFAAGLLNAAGLAGRLYFADGDCRLRGYALPSFAVLALPNVRSCSFSVSADGWLTDGEAVWQPNGSLAAVRRKSWIDVVTRAGEDFRKFRGSAPTWGPDGTLAYLRGGELLRWPGNIPILTEAELGRALRKGGSERTPLRRRPMIEEAVWLRQGALAVIAHLEPRSALRRPGNVLAVYDMGRGTAHVLARGLEISDLRPGPDGRYVAARLGPVLYLFPGDRPGPPVAVGPADAFVWSPDGRWLAIAAGATLSFLPVGREDGHRPTLRPIVAHDLAWRAARRAPPPPPTLARHPSSG